MSGTCAFSKDVWQGMDRGATKACQLFPPKTRSFWGAGWFDSWDLIFCWENLVELKQNHCVFFSDFGAEVVF